MHDQLLIAAARADFLTFLRLVFGELNAGRQFLPNWHHETLAHHLHLVTAGRCRRLAVNVPPRSLKSITVSVAYVAFLLGHDPTKRIFVVSHSMELARQHARDFRKIVESEWYQTAFPQMRVARTGDRTFETVTTQGGFRLATSIGTSVTGKGADLIIIDDPNKGDDSLSEAGRAAVNNYFDMTLYSRLDDKQRGAIILVMQRLHADDLTGHVLEQEEWTKLAVPAIETDTTQYTLSDRPGDVYIRSVDEVLQPDRDNTDVLTSMRGVMGSMAFEAQYQQNPLPAEGNLIKRSWLRAYHEPPEEFEFVVASWDPAMTIEESADYSVGTVWGLLRGEFYLLDVIRGRFETPELRKRILDLHNQWQPHQTIIEKAGVGHALVQDMRRGPVKPLAVTPRFDKKARLAAESAKFEAGRVLLPLDAPWLGPYLKELLAFPHGRNDDQVDSTSQALKYLTTKIASEPRAGSSRNINRPRPRGRIAARR